MQAVTESQRWIAGKGRGKAKEWPTGLQNRACCLSSAGVEGRDEETKGGGGLPGGTAGSGLQRLLEWEGGKNNEKSKALGAPQQANSFLGNSFQQEVKAFTSYFTLQNTL